MVRAEAAARLRLRRIAAHRLTWLDVFTDRPLAGNGLAVVHDADDLGPETMLAFARETRLSETTFVQSPGAAGADYRNRIWDPEQELPFAGHPSLGTAVAVAAAREQDRATFRQQTGAGVQPIEVERRDERLWTASMLQEPPVLGEEPDPVGVFAAVGLPADSAAGDLPPRFVSTGVPQLIAPVADPATLGAAAPDPAALRALLTPPGALVLYLVHVDGERARARAFAGSGSVDEDPATGSAAGPLCAYVHAVRGTERLEIDQGVEMGRPSRLRAEVAGDRIRVAGEVVVLVTGEVHLD